ncbi:MAG: ATP-dependent metallopeptidase FtsH/Yme1/Tma family protein [Gammaproteobacteria bacterium]|nr:ATP-dependent metallopeptidase FtsH/Yme1/Tma family protein [Gammaproteobacteria bacterium]
MNDMVRNLLVWGVILVVLLSMFSAFSGGAQQGNTVSYSQFLHNAENGNVVEATFSGDQIFIKTRDDRTYVTNNPESDNRSLIGELRDAGVEIRSEPVQGPSLLVQFLMSSAPFLLLIAVYIYFMRQMQGGGGGRGAMSFGKSKARLLNEDQVKVTFADVAGVEEAKEEVAELVDFLRDPGKFQKLGGKIPRGVLMVGPPGTGKTLLARAIAGEAKVPFFTISGSDFVEMFVGVGASRVRDMFEQAKKHSPCIIFIDEIDAVGRHRGSGMGGGHDEREQTLNQLLVEMDGFEGNEGVIVIAATNRPDVLDKALLRPGRFDRQVTVGLPDLRGREQILKVHTGKVPVAEEVRIDFLARGTPGFSGAELANLVNEAALMAARGNKRIVGMDEFEKAKDKILMGAERKSMVMSEKEKRLTAYHEAGHAIVGRRVPEHDPVYKVSIIPRGRALGVTMYLPDEDRHSHSRTSLESSIASLYGGRIAEQIIFGEEAITTGASNDIQRVTQLARNMVTRWGYSEKLGPLQYATTEDGAFGPGEGGQSAKFSGETAKLIDEEVRAICDRNYQRAHQILTDDIDVLHRMADALMTYETIDKYQIDNIFDGKEPGPPGDWKGPPSDSSNSGSSASSESEPQKDNAADGDIDGAETTH